jgi:hypothetical protein
MTKTTYVKNTKWDRVDRFYQRRSKPSDDVPISQLLKDIDEGYHHALGNRMLNKKKKRHGRST